MYAYIQLPEDGGPLTVEWMQGRLDHLHVERGRIMVDKKANNTKLAKKKESVLSELEKLRTLNRAHRKLMVEIWSHLTTLARVSICVQYIHFMSHYTFPCMYISS